MRTRAVVVAGHPGADAAAPARGSPERSQRSGRSELDEGPEVIHRPQGLGHRLAQQAPEVLTSVDRPPRAATLAVRSARVQRLGDPLQDGLADEVGVEDVVREAMTPDAGAEDLRQYPRVDAVSGSDVPTGPRAGRAALPVDDKPLRRSQPRPRTV